MTDVQQLANDWPAVVTAAGHATRFQPFGAHVPKEMLPLGETPAVGHVIGECLAAGAAPVYVVTRPHDPVVPAYVDDLRTAGAPVYTVPEDVSHGYGNAAGLLTLRRRLTRYPIFAVAFGDDVLLGDEPAADLTAMRQLAADGADAVVAAQPVARPEIGGFGAVVTDDSHHRVIGIRQRPDPDTITEPLALVSRLFLRPTILDMITNRPEVGGEIDLGAAVGDLARAGYVCVHRLAARWVTVGEPRRYLDALTWYWQHNDMQAADSDAT